MVILLLISYSSSFYLFFIVCKYIWLCTLRLMVIIRIMIIVIESNDFFFNFNFLLIRITKYVYCFVLNEIICKNQKFGKCFYSHWKHQFIGIFVWFFAFVSLANSIFSHDYMANLHVHQLMKFFISMLPMVAHNFYYTNYWQWRTINYQSLISNYHQFSLPHPSDGHIIISIFSAKCYTYFNKGFNFHICFI